MWHGGLNLSSLLLPLVDCLNPFWATITKYLTLGYLLKKMFILLTILGNEKFHQYGVGILAEVLPGDVTTDQVTRCGRSIFQRKKRSQDGDLVPSSITSTPRGVT